MKTNQKSGVQGSLHDMGLEVYHPYLAAPWILAKRVKDIMLFVLGFLMSFAGFAMVVVGQFTLPGQRVIKKKQARITGAIWLAVFPLVFLASFLSTWLEIEETVDPRLIYWILCVLCWFIGFGFLMPGLKGKPKPPTRKSKPPAPVFNESASAGPSESAPWPTPPADKGLPPTKTPRRQPPREKNPFDFS